ncbi:hypothetical protein JOF33_000920 [Corynebacterium freneyi]|uniref:Uncharacterized protein n=1 Tax=Corynebacterium freneyi TaxID=134034 RepID=A0ABS4U6D9_9CORY|nr:hypothetical protein [Corynebacterium freneyi]
MLRGHGLSSWWLRELRRRGLSAWWLRMLQVVVTTLWRV